MGVEIVWTPLGVRRDGMAAIAVASLLSVGSIAFLLSFCAYYVRIHYRLPPSERQYGETRGLTFIRSDYFIVFVNLLVGDLLQGIGFSMNTRWLAKGAFPSYPTNTCTTQAVLIQMGDLSSAFGSLLIGVHISLILVLGYKIPRNVLYYLITLLWAVVAVFAFVGPRFLTVEGHPFYGWAGGWCWISSYPAYQPYKLHLHYLWVFIVAFLNLVLYGIIVGKLVRGNRLLGHTRINGSTSSAAKIMLFYPLVYIFTILPLSAFRIAALAGHPWSIYIQLAAGTIFTLSGFANTVVYAVTRSIVTVDTVDVVRRASSFTGSAVGSRRGSPGNANARLSVGSVSGSGSASGGEAPSWAAYTISSQSVNPVSREEGIPVEPRRTQPRKVSFAGWSDLEKESMGGSIRRPSGTDSLP